MAPDTGNHPTREIAPAGEAEGVFVATLGLGECRGECGAASADPGSFPELACDRCRAGWVASVLASMPTERAEMERLAMGLEHLIQEKSGERDLDTLYVLQFARYMLVSTLRGAGPEAPAS